MIELKPNEVKLSQMEIGTGGRYRVYRAVHAGEFVAAKSVIDLDGEDVRKTDYDLQQEHETLEKLDHPAIPRTRGLWRDPQTGILHHIMELRSGRTLEQVVLARAEKNQGRAATVLPEPEGITLDILGQVFGALAHAHERGVFHNDVSPRNIHVNLDSDDQLVVALMDFEAASSVERGTLAFTAPERMRGEPPSVQTDLYSCGVLVFFVLTGLLPWVETDATAALLERPGRPLNNLRSDESRQGWREINRMPSHIGSALLRATAPNPAERPASMRAFMRELQVPIAEPPTRRDPSLTWTGAGLAAVALALLGPALFGSFDVTLLRRWGEVPSACRRELRATVPVICRGHTSVENRKRCETDLTAMVNAMSSLECEHQRAVFQSVQTTARHATAGGD